MSRRARACAVAVALTAAVAGCGEPPGDESADVASANFSTVTFRLWDETAADAYRESFDAFNAIRPSLQVEIEVVPRESYAAAVATDLADGTMADIFWTTSDAVTAQARSGYLLPLAETLGEDREEWQPAVTALYTDEDELWAVPQLWDATVLFYNSELLEQSDVDPTTLSWDPAAAPGTRAATDEEPAPADDAEPSPAPDPEATAEEPAPDPASDTLRRAVRELTRDTSGRAATDEEFDPADVGEYGFNTDLTAPAVWLPFLVQLWSAPSDEQGLTLDDPAGRAAFSYLAELPGVGPEDAALTARQLFTSGGLALYQSTSADMRHLQALAQIEWDMAPVPAGPDGPVAVVDGVAAAANAASDDPEATAEVLRWLASTDGQSALASQGVGIPAAAGAQELYRAAWADRGVDVSAALDVEVVTAASGPQAQEVLEAVRPALASLFQGEAEVGAALAAAQASVDQILGAAKTP